MRKRVFYAAVVFLAVLLAPDVFATGGQEQQSVPTETAGPATVSVFIRDWVGLSFDNEVTKAIEKATNTKLNMIAVPPDDTNSKLNLLVASKQIPDIFQGYDTPLYIQMWQNSVMLPLNKHWDRLPNVYKSREASTWEIMKESDGNIYQIPISEYKDNPNYVPMYRKDWLDKLGFAIPKTLDEYTKVALAVSKNDPDGDGKNNTYASGGWNGMSDRRIWSNIMGAFGVQLHAYKLVDGKITACDTMPQMKEAIKYVASLYKAGALDPEFATDDESRVKQKFLSGLYGAMYYKIFLFDLANINNYHDTFYKNNPNAKLVIGTLVSQPGYTPMAPLKLSAYGWLHTGIYAQSKVVDAAMRVVDYLTTDEGNILVAFGFPNTDYTPNSDGTITVKSTQDQQNALGIPQWNGLVSVDLPYNNSKPYLDALNYCVSISQPDMLGGIYETSPEEVKYGEAVRSFAHEQLTRMVAGDLPIDASWDSFVKEFNDRGGAILTAAFDTAYKARQRK
jgi:putative aldouronate transport system substrate-binding protein